MKKIRFGLIVASGLLVMAGLFLTARHVWAQQQVRRAWMAPIPEAPDLATTTQLEIIPLYEEAGTRDDLESGHGVAYLIRTDTSTVLLDVGNNPEGSDIAPFVQNASALGLDGADLDAIVITHPHPDHVGGQDAWTNDTLGLGGAPTTWDDLPVYVPTDIVTPNATLSRQPTQITPEIASTGVLSYAEVFPLSLFTAAVGGEQAIVIHVADQGLVVITGCGHPGLENIVLRAEALYQEPVVGVVGGLHYGNARAEDLADPIAFVASREMQLLAMSPHDSEPEALDAFASALPGAYHTLRVGEAIQFP